MKSNFIFVSLFTAVLCLSCSVDTMRIYEKEAFAEIQLPVDDRNINDASLSSIIRRAIKNADRVKIAGEDYASAVAKLWQARSNRFPSVSFRTQYNRLEESPAFGSSAGLSPRASDAELFNIKQEIFGGLRDYYSIKSADLYADSKRNSILRERANIVQIVAGLFYEAKRIEGRIMILDNTIKTREQRRDLIEALKKQQLARETDYLAVKAQLAKDRADLELTKTQLEIVKSELNILIAGEISGQLTDDMGDVTFESMNSLLNEAVKQRPDLNALHLEVESRKSAIKSIRGEFSPTIGFSANGYLHREGLLEDTDWDFLLGIEFSIFEGGLTQARMSETYSLLRKSQYAYDLLKKNIGAEISQLWHRYNSSSAVIKSLEESVSLSKERYSLLELQYKNQLASELDLRNADLEYQAAAEQLSSEQINRKQIIIQLLVSIGKIK